MRIDIPEYKRSINPAPAVKLALEKANQGLTVAIYFGNTAFDVHRDLIHLARKHGAARNWDGSIHYLILDNDAKILINQPADIIIVDPSQL